MLILALGGGGAVGSIDLALVVEAVDDTEAEGGVPEDLGVHVSLIADRPYFHMMRVLRYVSSFGSCEAEYQVWAMPITCRKVGGPVSIASSYAMGGGSQMGGNSVHSR